jgi:hypothetical protein
MAMQSLIAPRARPRTALAALATAALLAAGGAAEAAGAPCPWIVQPHVGAAQPGDDDLAFEIMFDGFDPAPGAFYGFSVSSLDVAWKLVGQSSLPSLDEHGRPLEPVVTRYGEVVYRLAPDTIEPHTIYLVAARAPIPELEEIDARIKNPRPYTQMALRTRGASDQSGPLPHMSVPGIPVSEAAAAATPASVQICAYQVAMH